MEPKYKIGQQVTVRDLVPRTSDVREAEISNYSNKTGIVTNYFSISPNWGTVFYLYTVRISEDKKDIVLHEDEIK